VNMVTSQFACSKCSGGVFLLCLIWLHFCRACGVAVHHSLQASSVNSRTLQNDLFSQNFLISVFIKGF
jgi:hypothetical protein